MWRQECALVEQSRKDPCQLVRWHDRYEASAAITGSADPPIQNLPILRFHPASKPLLQALDSIGISSWQSHSRQGGDHPDECLHLDRLPVPGGIGEQVIEESVVRVIATRVLKRIHDEDQLLEELHDHVLIDGVALGKEYGQGEHRD